MSVITVYAVYVLSTEWAGSPGGLLLVVFFSQGRQAVRQVPVVPLQIVDLLDQDFLLMQLELNTAELLLQLKHLQEYRNLSSEEFHQKQ